MTNNLFDTYQQRKEALLKIADQAAEWGWIPRTLADRQPNAPLSREEIAANLDKDTLTIGVIGQMKCGKSTFLNAFVFGDTVLPAATTPMTAALSVITYGEQKRVVAEFYTADEWEEQRHLAEMAPGSASESKIQAARELVAKAVKLGNELPQLLGSSREDSLENLIEYVGADGRYVSITKAVTIYYPKESLKGVQIVDTPGFNDPIVSREERTKAFLNQADVVLMMLYAGRPFDATDREIIFKHVRECGIGRVLVGINKYDIPFGNGETEEEIKDYVTEEIRKAGQAYADDSLWEILQQVEPIPLSAEMALLSELPMSRISESEVLDFAWRRHCDTFGVTSQQEMRRLSHMERLVQAIQQLIDREKAQILFAKPLNSIRAAGARLQADYESRIAMLKNELRLLQLPDTSYDEELENLSKAERKVQRKVEYLEMDLQDKYRKLKQDGTRELKEVIHKGCEQLRSAVDGWGRFKNVKHVQAQLESISKRLRYKDIPEALAIIANTKNSEIRKLLQEFFNEMELVLSKYSPKMDAKSSLARIRDAFCSADNVQAVAVYAPWEDKDAPSSNLFGEVVETLVNTYSLGLWKAMCNAIEHNDTVSQLKRTIDDMEYGFDFNEQLNPIFRDAEQVSRRVRHTMESDLFVPIREEIQNIQNGLDKKEQAIEESTRSLSDAQAGLEQVTAQLQRLTQLTAEL